MMFDCRSLGTITDLKSGASLRGEAWSEGVCRRAGHLRMLQTCPRPIVAIYHGNTPEFFLDLFAVWSMGGCAACLNPGLTRTEVETVVNWLQPMALLIDERCETQLDQIGTPVRALAKEAASDDSQALSRSASSLDDPALILFTSGTTGDPKGVVLTFRALLARVALNRAHIGAAALARTLCVLPTHFGHGLIGNCLTPLIGGDALFLSPGADVRTVSGLGSIIDSQSISFMSAVPSYWRIAGKFAKPPQTESLKRVHVGSAPLPAGLWQEIVNWTGTEDVVNAYGITETANWIGGASARRHQPEDGLIGSPWGGTIAVLGEDGRIQSAGEGELVVQTPSLFSSYHRQPALTAAALVDGWYRTGDLGVVDDRGIARLLGRQKEEINRAGIKINPTEVDLLLERHTAVAEVCAFGIDDAVSGEAVAVCVRLEDETGLSIEDLRRWCQTRIRREAIPERWFLVDEIPKTERGKVDRKQVRDFCLEKVD